MPTTRAVNVKVSSENPPGVAAFCEQRPEVSRESQFKRPVSRETGKVPPSTHIDGNPVNQVLPRLHYFHAKGEDGESNK